MKSTEQLIRENNVKALRLNNTDRVIFENYMNYIRADLRVNPHDTELLLNKILKHLLQAEDTGMHAMDFFEHDPKQHAKNKIKTMPNHTFQNIFQYFTRHCLLLIGLFCFFKGFLGFFMGEQRLYFFSFPITIVTAMFIIGLFIWTIFKTIQLQCFSKSNWIWIFTYASVIGLIVALFYVIFIPQSFLAFGPSIIIGNWTFIIISLIMIPLALYIEHRLNEHDNTSVML